MLTLSRETCLDPSWPFSRTTCGIWFGGGNFRLCSVSGIEFCGRYAIAPLPIAIYLHPLGGDFVGEVSSTQFTVPNLLCSSLPLADLSYIALVLAACPINVLFLCLSSVHWSSG
ncbi:hypothetical protein B9Z19DRAFT_1091021 [Tuber borchii]|uniref:Uncharacterized protein n=1 Tax=Tuber borchii TaxID=42251 RepID=A0A2T6ZI44_TUBBO|nr:hypothetical protein B9Z19DRAFT_1091021 [Tuber borchii]